MHQGKRDFLKMTALAVSAVAANSLLPQSALAAFTPGAARSAASKVGTAGVRAGSGALPAPISMDECQSLSYRAMAARSSMVQVAWLYLRDQVNSLEKQALRDLVTAIYGDSTPRLARMDAGTRRKVWKELKGAGYTDRDEADFLPPVVGDMASRYPAVSAPGSGYGSHHSYPGGLITHVAANVMITSAIVDTYKNVYGYEVDRDIAMAAQLLHDLHKPYVFQWGEDASSRTEQPLAGTGEHHVLSLAELLVRKAPADLVVAQACAHTHPGTEADERQVVGWLKAAAIIAGVDPVAYGLLERGGMTVPQPRRQEGFICHLGDHDFVLSVPAVQWTLPVMREIARTDYGLSGRDLDGKPFNSLRNMVFSQLSAMRIQQASTGGVEEVRALMHSVVTPG